MCEMVRPPCPCTRRWRWLVLGGTKGRSADRLGNEGEKEDQVTRYEPNPAHNRRIRRYENTVCGTGEGWTRRPYIFQRGHKGS
jgi:hypothetical protein